MKNSVEAFYEYLTKKTKPRKRLVELVDKWTLSETIDFIIECKQLLPKDEKKSNSIFNFVANSSLSGEDFLAYMPIVDCHVLTPLLGLPLSIPILC